MTRNKPSFMEALMAEPIRLPGVPQFIVTRAEAYRFCRALGMDAHGKGFGSIDTLVFLPAPVDAPLSDINVLQVAAKIAAIEAESAARFARAEAAQ